MKDRRHLIVVADDFGIGPATSEGILALAAQGRVTATVLLVTSPHAEAAVQSWRSASAPLELGWHPCLTLDRPVLPARRVPTLVQRDGRFHPLGRFLGRLFMRQLCPHEIEAELAAQLQRFQELVGKPPRLVNGHHHLHIFGAIGRPLRKLLATLDPLPYIRRVREPWHLLATIPGGRLKRSFLSLIGATAARHQTRAGFPGNDCLVGVTSPECWVSPGYLDDWLARAPGRRLELVCHPGFRDATLQRRDEAVGDPEGIHRQREYELLAAEGFLATCRRRGLELTAPALLGNPEGALAHVA